MADDENKQLDTIATQYLALQREEMDLRARELQIAATNDENNNKISLATLEAQAKDLEAQRRVGARESTKRKFFWGFVFISFLVTITVMVFGGYADFVKEFVVDIVQIGAGVLAGSSGTLIYYNMKNR